jgi:signal transduction histidine kinase
VKSQFEHVTHSAAQRISTLVERLRGKRAVAAAAADPSQRLFAGTRRRLSLWYTGVLGAILVVAGVLLYLGMSEALLAPVTSVLQLRAAALQTDWQQTGVMPPACSDAPYRRDSAPIFVACYDSHGSLVGTNRLADLSADFLNTSLARSALGSASASASDIVPGAANFGTLQRVALVARSAGAHTTLGVVQVGVSIEGDYAALRTLVVLLLLVGLLTLLGSAIGGILLAHRALGPARLAFARQQAFTADAAHELRTPLTLLRTDAEVLLTDRTRFDPDDVVLLEDIVAEAEHLSTLTTHLLDLARLDAPDYHIEREVVALDEVVARTAERIRTLAEQKQVTVTIETDGEPLIIGDGTWINHAALILADNAIKYNRPGGTVVLRAFLDQADAVLEVRDTGVGIAPKHLEHLGERFYRVDKARSRALGGAGLGLSIARGIAVAHNGSLTFMSAPDSGTTATLRLPAANQARET